MGDYYGVYTMISPEFRGISNLTGKSGGFGIALNIPVAVMYWPPAGIVMLDGHNTATPRI